MKFIQLFTLALFLFSGCGRHDRGTRSDHQVVHQQVLTIDTHLDTPMRLLDEDWDIGKFHPPGQQRRGRVDIPRIRQGGMDALFFAAFIGQRRRTGENYAWAQKETETLIAAIKNMCENHTGVALATKAHDAFENEKKGLISIYIGLENGFPLATDPANIEKYYRMGVRYITLCHVRNNDICDSSTDPGGAEHNGLSDFGKKVVAEMNRLGVIIDVSHISDRALYDVLDHSRAPVMASHSCARAVCDNPRNLDDDMLRELARHDGVLQICVLSEYVKKMPENPVREAKLDSLRGIYGPWADITDEAVKKKYLAEYYAVNDKYPRPLATVADVVDHIDHVVNLVGIDHVGIGTDFDGGGGLNGLDDISEMGNITAELVSRGYSKQQIEKIWGGNFLRVFRAVEKTASNEG